MISLQVCRVGHLRNTLYRGKHTLPFITAAAAHKSTSGTLYSLGEYEHVHQRIRQMERKKPITLVRIEYPVLSHSLRAEALY